MAVNLGLFLLKITAGWLGRSQALMADGVHSLSDLLSDVVVLLGLKWGRQEEDETHPFGHARIETISGMLIGLLLVGTGVALAYRSISAIYYHTESSPGMSAIIAAAISIGVKEGLYWYTLRVGRRIKSLALIANAWHHRSDALSSIAVLVGVTGAYLSPAWAMADAYAALLVTFFVAKIGAELIWSAAKEVIDTAPDRKVMAELATTALEVEGVRQTHDIRARLSGGRIFAEVHIVVDPDLTVQAGHEIADNVKQRLLQGVAGMARVIVHVDPDLKH
jgi:cation diffusion facilitator family transporter